MCKNRGSIVDIPTSKLRRRNGLELNYTNNCAIIATIDKDCQPKLTGISYPDVRESRVPLPATRSCACTTQSIYIGQDHLRVTIRAINYMGLANFFVLPVVF